MESSKPKIGLEHDLYSVYTLHVYMLYINIYMTVQSKPLEYQVEKQQGLQTHKQAVTLSIAQHEGARCQALVIFYLK